MASLLAEKNHIKLGNFGIFVFNNFSDTIYSSSQIISTKNTKMWTQKKNRILVLFFSILYYHDYIAFEGLLLFIRILINTIIAREQTTMIPAKSWFTGIAVLKKNN